MNAIAFDTHEFVKELKGAGFSEQQAEVITKLQKTSIAATLEQAKHDYQLDELVIRRDLKELELALKKEIEALRSETKLQIAETNVKIAESKAELVRWVVGVGLLQTALIAGLMIKLSASL